MPAQDSLLHPLSAPGRQHRVSLYADGVVLFIKPIIEDLELIKGVLQIFGDVSGLKTNILKCSVTPIQCQEMDLAIIQDLLPCEVKNFPCSYLGLPLLVRKIANLICILLLIGWLRAFQFGKLL